VSAIAGVKLSETGEHESLSYGWENGRLNSRAVRDNALEHAVFDVDVQLAKIVGTLCAVHLPVG
jgi:hypothetical protein